MNGTYLISSYADKDAIKGLGARWDPLRRQWYVPDGRDIAPFRQWLPAGVSVETAVAVIPSGIDSSAEIALAKAKGIPLSKLLSGVAQAVADTFKAGVWTIVEVVDTRVRNGHVYLEVSERDTKGAITAKANAVIWATTASRILPEFQNATGAQLAPGIKLMVRARPVFKAQYGFSLEVDAIDSEYTLGDLEARKREIRERLQQEGLFALNRNLPRPWDYTRVLVIAPEGGAGLGDFQAEASRLESHGVCHFTYAFSLFQGDGAAQQIRMAMLSALEQIRLNHNWLPDAVVIIRGGGAVNDMAWLNDYALVRSVCELEIPVLTGIGHERDNTVLDEVANIRFDTPSKVIAGIEQVIVQRARDAQSMFDQTLRRSQRMLEQARRASTQTYTALEAGARQAVAHGRQASSEVYSALKLEAAYSIRSASDTSQRVMTEARHFASQQLGMAKREVPALMTEIRTESRQALRSSKLQSEAQWNSIAQSTSTSIRTARENAKLILDDSAAQSTRTLRDAKERSQGLLREITGQGPEKTLRRGFAVVRNAKGLPVTSAFANESEVQIQFTDGQRAARLKDPQP
jgi:exodeoxyribonuclease VII large subunit